MNKKYILFGIFTIIAYFIYKQIKNKKNLEQTKPAINNKQNGNNKTIDKIIYYDENNKPIFYNPNEVIYFDENGKAVYYDKNGKQIYYEQAIINNGDSK